MMDMIENIRHEEGVIYFDLDSDVTVVKFVIPLGFADLIQKSGYAHLIEHMIIQANKKYLVHLEKQGIQFNAETKDCMTEYIFIDLQSNLLLDELKKGNLEKIFRTEFKEESLEIERGTIAQEHLLLCNQMDEADVSDMIGKREEIENFKLMRADSLRKDIYSKYNTMVFTNSVIPEVKNCKEDVYIDEANWFDNITFLKFIRCSEYVEFEMEKELHAEILTYCLRILFCDMLRSFGLKIQRLGEIICIRIIGNIENIESVIQYKSNAYHHYYLLLTSFKYLCNEVTYVTQHLVNNIDIKKMYMSSNWEEKLYEKIGSKK